MKFSEFILKKGVENITLSELDDYLQEYLIETNQIISVSQSDNSSIPNNSSSSYAERIIRERNASTTKSVSVGVEQEVGQNYSDPLLEGTIKIPTNWEEAKAQVPGLSKWVTIKAAALATDPNRPVHDILVEHLRNTDTGLGKWTTGEGLPKKLLRKIDESLSREIMRSGTLPGDIKLSVGSVGRPRNAETLTSEQVREARRIAALGTRRGM